MEDAIKQNQEQAIQEEQQQLPAQDNPVDETAPMPAQASAESESDKNFRKLREEAQRAKKERDEAVSILKQIEQQALIYQQEQQKQATSNEEEDTIDNDDYTPRKYVDNRYKKLESKLSAYEKKIQEQTAEQQLRSQFKDFDDVVSRKNIDMLRESYPEVAASIAANPDLKTKAQSAYTIIKKLGIHAEDSFSGDRKRAESNAYKPRPSNSISSQQGSSPLQKANAFANGLTDDLKKQLYKEMIESRNQG